MRARPGDGIGGAFEAATGDRRKIRNEIASPGETTVEGNRITAAERAAVGEAPLLKSREEQIGIGKAADDVRLCLAALAGGQRGRIVAEAKVGADARIEHDGRTALREVRVGGGQKGGAQQSAGSGQELTGSTKTAQHAG